MKRFVKICLMISAVCLLIGIAFCVSGRILGATQKDLGEMAARGELSIGSNAVDWLIDDGEAQTFDTDYNAIQNLEISLDYGELEFRNSDDNRLHVKATNVSNSYRCRQDGDTLVISDEKKAFQKFFGVFRTGKSHGGRVILYIPEKSRFDEVEIDLGAGKLSANGQMWAGDVNIDLGAGQYTGGHIKAARELSINVGAGEFVDCSFEAGELSLDCGAGRISAVGEFQREGEVDCGLGEIKLTLKGAREDYNYHIEGGVGDIDIGGDSYSGINNDRNINNKASKNFGVSCGMGKVTIDFEK